MNVELFATVKGTVDVSKSSIKVNGSDISEPNGANRVRYDCVHSYVNIYNFIYFVLFRLKVSFVTDCTAEFIALSKFELYCGFYS